jgi:hypothetical protein
VRIRLPTPPPPRGRRSLSLTHGNGPEGKDADRPIGGTVGMKRMIAGCGYDADRIRAIHLAQAGCDPGDPGS